MKRRRGGGRKKREGKRGERKEGGTLFTRDSISRRPHSDGCDARRGMTGIFSRFARLKLNGGFGFLFPVKTRGGIRFWHV